MIDTQNKRICSVKPLVGSIEQTPPFPGFTRPNVVQTPNHFLDVVCSHPSNPVIKVVGFLLYQHLAWNDAKGNPLHERFHWGQREIAEGAKVSRGKIEKVLQTAVDAKFLRRVRRGKKALDGKRPLKDIWEINWHDYGGVSYGDSLRNFQGFWPLKNGCYTNIPEEFFHVVIPYQNRSVTQVVAVVIAKTIGQKTAIGLGRVQEADIAYNYILKKTGLARSNVWRGLEKAISEHFIHRVKRGEFKPGDTSDPDTSTYALSWRESATYGRSVTQIEPGQVAEERHPNRTRSVTQIEPKKRHPNRTNEILSKESIKQQQTRDPVVAVDKDFEESMEELITAGFDYKTAKHLASIAPLEEIKEQVKWLPYRNPKNPQGMLRKAIEESWDEPAELKSFARETQNESADHSPSIIDPLASRFAEGFYAGCSGKERAFARPSVKDLEEANRFVEHLSEIIDSPDEEQLDRCGRQFGKFFMERRGSLAKSFSAASKLFGDDFLSGQARRQREAVIQARRVAEQATEKRREAHYERFESAWLQYLKERVDRFKHEQPEEFSKFEAAEKAKRLELELQPFSSLLLRFDPEETKLRSFSKAFPEQAYDFWQWDDTINPSGL